MLLKEKMSKCDWCWHYFNKNIFFSMLEMLKGILLVHNLINIMNTQYTVVIMVSWLSYDVFVFWGIDIKLKSLIKESL